MSAREMKSISFSGNRGASILHIEAPGCVINIHRGLHDIEGREVTAVHIQADKYAGEINWTMPDFDNASHLAVRVVQTGEKEKTK